MNKRQEYIDKIVDKLQQINTANGFSTDIGNKVSKGIIADYDYSDGTPFLFVAETIEKNVIAQSALSPPQTRVDLFFQVICFYKREEIDPHDEGRTIIADVQKALFVPNEVIDLYYIDSQIDSESIGLQFVSVIINLKTNYLLNFCKT